MQDLFPNKPGAINVSCKHCENRMHAELNMNCIQNTTKKDYYRGVHNGFKVYQCPYCHGRVKIYY